MRLGVGVEVVETEIYLRRRLGRRLLFLQRKKANR